MAQIKVHLPLYRKWRNEEGWSQSPLSTDIPQETVEQWYDLPVTSRQLKRDGRGNKFDYRGYQAGPLADDNDLLTHKEHYELPQLLSKSQSRGNKRDYTGWTQQPLAADNDLLTRHEWTDLPERGRGARGWKWSKRDWSDILIWTESPLAADIAQETINLTQDENPVLKRRNLSKHIDWQRSPLSDDIPQETVHSQEFTNPQTKEKKKKYSFEGWLQQPLAADVIVSEDFIGRLFYDVPKGKKKAETVHWEQQPLSDDIPQETISHQFDNPVIREKRRKYSFDGWEQQPLSSDIAQETISQRWELPVIREKKRKYSFDGFTQAPLAADVPQETVNLEVYALAPTARKRVNYNGWQSPPLSDDAVVVQEALHAAQHFDLPIGHSRPFKLSWMPSQISAPVGPDAAAGGHKPRLTILGCGH